MGSIFEKLLGSRVATLAIPGGRAVRIPLAFASPLPLDCLVFSSTARKGPLVGSTFDLFVFHGLGSVVVVEDLVSACKGNYKYAMVLDRAAAHLSKLGIRALLLLRSAHAALFGRTFTLSNAIAVTLAVRDPDTVLIGRSFASPLR